jgi:hypothetical protein
MAQGLRRHLSFANVTSLMALVFAMGGTGYALTIPKNSVGSKQLRKNAVTGVKVKSRSLRASDFARGQLTAGPRGAPGAAGGPGLTGPAGPAGAKGERGLPGVVGAVTVERRDFGLPDGNAAGMSVPCPGGTRAVGGGSEIAAITSDDVHATVSRPDRTGAAPATGETFDGWRVTYRNPTGGTGATTVHAFAICAED